MTCCGRGVMDQGLAFRGLHFFDSIAECQSSGRTVVGQGGQRNTKRVSVLRERWHSRAGSSSCRECQCTGQTAVSARLLWLAKQIISFLIMISRVIIYTKRAHSPILRRLWSCFLSPRQGEDNALPCVLLNTNGSRCCLQRNKSLCPTPNVI